MDNGPICVQEEQISKAGVETLNSDSMRLYEMKRDLQHMQRGLAKSTRQHQTTKPVSVKYIYILQYNFM